MVSLSEGVRAVEGVIWPWTWEKEKGIGLLIGEKLQDAGVVAREAALNIISDK